MSEKRNGLSAYLFIALIVLSLPIFMVGCGSDSSDDTTDTTTETTTKKACDLTATLYVCTDFSGSDFTETYVSALCTENSGTLLTSCPTTDLLGYCTEGSGASDEKSNYYYPSIGLTADQLSESCTTAGNTWTAAQ
jgi:hypothetical protein